ncbi:MAG: response regulator [Proteobacteria bacterium]|nr:response regulator [Pseudomonadota bacterium]
MSIFKKTEEVPKVPDSDLSRLDELRRAVNEVFLPEHACKSVIKEIDRLEKTDPSLAEYSIGLNYLDFILALPWNNTSGENLDLGRAERILDGEHLGLDHVKERILEHMAAGIMFSKKPSKILVVDDESIALENIRHVLTKENHDVSIAGNGQAALELFEHTEFDLVVTDLKMEKMNGIQLMERVQQKFHHTRFIITTGYATVETAVDALKKGAAHYLPKPLKLDTLRQTVKEVLNRKRTIHMARGTVLCFAGPPGIGKTSVGRSIAHAFDRKFVGLSMAGLRDEAELRGHRRTYVGALPGRILTELQRAGVKNPVFMLDEIDKIGQDFRGDPASILLEVLDPQQNDRFLDYYADIPFDLSQVMFITTANAVEKLPPPLLDRMEIIPFSSYTIGEKKRIARDYLIPRQLKAHGLDETDLTFTETALDGIVQGYTREAGLRNLERAIASICRKMDRIILSQDVEVPQEIDEGDVLRFLGPPKIVHEIRENGERPGVATGLVWTEFGGQIIFVETALMKGNQNLITTGSLGEVLKESAQTALSFIRSSAEQFGIDPNFFKGNDIHIHIPAGSVPKDGPSAGITIALALISLLTGHPVRNDVAVSGELTLSGRLLPVSGLREKILAAQQAGIKTVILPARNEVGIEALDREVKESAAIVPADSVETVVNFALRRQEDSDDRRSEVMKA